MSVEKHLRTRQLVQMSPTTFCRAQERIFIFTEIYLSFVNRTDQPICPITFLKTDLSFL
jgi:hypothetical protein